MSDVCCAIYPDCCILESMTDHREHVEYDESLDKTVRSSFIFPSQNRGFRQSVFEKRKVDR